MKKIVMAMALACAALGQSAAWAQDAQGNFKFEDRREHVEEHWRRSSIFAPVAVFGEETLKPPVLPRLQEAFKARSIGLGDVNVEIEDFTLMDYFPGRQPTHMHGVIPDLMSGAVAEERKKHVEMVERLHLAPEGETLILTFRAKINDKVVDVEVAENYKTPMLGVVVWNSKSFKTALSKLIDDGAGQAMKQAAAQPTKEN